MSNIALDGVMAYGVTVGASGVLTIGGVSYKAVSVTPTRGVQEAHDYNPDGTPNRSRYTIDFDECALEVQLATSSTVPPLFGATFSMTFNSTAGAETWVVMPNEPAQTNDGGAIRTATFTAKKVYIAITTV